MTLCRSGTIACALLWLGLLVPTASQAACSDKTLRGMADAGRSVATIAKRCGTTVAAVKDRLETGEAKSKRAQPETPPPARTPPAAEAPPSPAASSASGSKSAAKSSANPAAKPSANAAAKVAPEPQPHPPGTVLELCGCYGNMQYGFTESNAQCLSGKAVATRCPGYCPVNRSPWRRICS